MPIDYADDKGKAVAEESNGGEDQHSPNRLSTRSGRSVAIFGVLQKQVNEMCRKRPQRVAFYSVDCRGSCGEIFVDLQNHTYTQMLTCQSMVVCSINADSHDLEEALRRSNGMGWC
eukprot:Gb_18556 [translate_table: standard]